MIKYHMVCCQINKNMRKKIRTSSKNLKPKLKLKNKIGKMYS